MPLDLPTMSMESAGLLVEWSRVESSGVESSGAEWGGVGRGAIDSDTVLGVATRGV